MSLNNDIRWIIREMEKAYAISAPLKIVMDRTGSICNKGTLKNKIGVAVVAPLKSQA